MYLYKGPHINSYRVNSNLTDTCLLAVVNNCLVDDVEKKEAILLPPINPTELKARTIFLVPEIIVTVDVEVKSLLLIGGIIKYIIVFNNVFAEL